MGMQAGRGVSAGGAGEGVICADCGKAPLGPVAMHALLCACGPSTRGHNCVRGVLFDIASPLGVRVSSESIDLNEGIVAREWRLERLRVESRA